MKTVSFADAQSGLFNGMQCTASTEDGIALNTPKGMIAVEGAHDDLSKRLDLTTGEVIDYQPPAPSADHEWNKATLRWQLSAVARAVQLADAAARATIAAAESAQARAMRELLLGDQSARARLQALDDDIAAARKQLKKTQ